MSSNGLVRSANALSDSGSPPRVSVIIGFRDWGLERLCLAVRAHLASRSADQIEVIVVDYGSEDAVLVRQSVEQAGGRVFRVEVEGRWSRGRALNFGIRQAARGDLILTTDSDILYGRDTIGATLRAIDAAEDSSRAFALVQCRDLPSELSVERLLHLDWSEMETMSKERPQYGMGGCACFPRSFIEDIRGYDERMEWWGAEDNDLVARAEAVGMKPIWVDDEDARIYHVWHEKTTVKLDGDREFARVLAQNRTILHETSSPYRNLDEWGGLPSPRVPVSVVIVTRDRAELLGHAIQSVLDQSYQNFELLIIDDGSGDHTARVVDDFGDPRICYVAQEPSGIPVARNLGVRRARGQYVCIMDDDDLMMPDRLKDQFDAIRGGAVGSYGGWIDFEQGASELDYHPGKRRTFATLLFGSKVMVHAASMIRRDVLLRFPYNEKFAFGSDFDLNLRLVEAGHELNHTGTYLLMRRMHGQNVTTTDSSAQKNTARTSVRERRAAIPTVDREQMAMKAKREKPASIRDVAPEQLRAMFPKALSGDSHRRAPRSHKKEKRLKRSTLIAYSCGGVFVASLALLIGWNSEALFRGDIVMLGAISLLGLMLAVAGGVYLFRVIKQLRKQVKGLRSDVRHDQNRLEKIVRDNHDQALHQMRLIQSEAEIAKLGLMPMSVQSSWSAAADFLTILMRELADHRPQTIVELGPGTSTLVMAKCLQDLALDARIYAVEHDQRYATETSRLLEANGLEDCVEVVIAPIVDTPLGPYYDLEKLLPNLVSIDLLVIDGPPGETDAEARFPALPFFSPLLSNGGIMLLNDGHRGDERVIVARWKSEFPDLEVQFIDNSRGCFRFRKPVGNSAIVQTDLDTCDQGNP